MAERARLLAVAVEGDGVAGERLDNEVADHAAVVHQHARAVGVEDADYPDIDAVLAVVVEAEGLGDALALVVAGAVGVDVDPVGLDLRVDLGVAVDLAGGRWSMRARVRLHRPSMLMVPITEVLTVLTGLNW